jgi:hypothetical protein
MTTHDVNSPAIAIIFARVSARGKMRALALDWRKMRGSIWRETVLKNAVAWRVVDSHLSAALAVVKGGAK